MSEDENDAGESRYFIKILDHSKAAAVFDSLAGSSAPPIKTYAGPDRLLRASVYAERLEQTEAEVKPLTPEQAELDLTRALESLADAARAVREASEVLLAVCKAAEETTLSATQTAQDAEGVLRSTLGDSEAAEKISAGWTTEGAWVAPRGESGPGA